MLIEKLFLRPLRHAGQRFGASLLRFIAEQRWQGAQPNGEGRRGERITAATGLPPHERQAAADLVQLSDRGPAPKAEQLRGKQLPGYARAALPQNGLGFIAQRNDIGETAFEVCGHTATHARDTHGVRVTKSVGKFAAGGSELCGATVGRGAGRGGIDRLHREGKGDVARLAGLQCKKEVAGLKMGALIQIENAKRRTG